MIKLFRLLAPFLLAASLLSQTTPTVQVDNWVALKALNVTGVGAAKMTALMKGRVTTNDGGGGIFFFTPTAGATDDGGTIATPNAGTGAWFRQYSGPVNALWFGAVHDGATDNTAALNKALLAARFSTLYIPGNTSTYVCAGTLNVPASSHIVGDGMGAQDADVTNHNTVIVSSANVPLLKFNGTDSTHLAAGFTMNDIQLVGGDFSSPLIELYFACNVRLERVGLNHRTILIDGLCWWDSTVFQSRFDRGGSTAQAAIRLSDTNYDGTISTDNMCNNLHFISNTFEDDVRAISMVQHSLAGQAVYWQDTKIENDYTVGGKLVEVSGYSSMEWKNTLIAYGSGPGLSANSTDLMAVTNVQGLIIDGITFQGVGTITNSYVKSALYLETVTGGHIDNVIYSCAVSALTTPGTSLVRFGANNVSYFGNITPSFAGNDPVLFSGTLLGSVPYLPYGTFINGLNPVETNTNLFGMSFEGGQDALNLAPEGGSASHINFKTASAGSTLATTKMKINASGEVDIAGGLVVTNGPITVGGSGVIVGTGTANTIPKFTSTNTIGNSSVTDNGTVVTLNGTGETIQATNTASVLNIKSETPTDIPQLVDVYSTTVAAGIAGRRARGTIASPTAVQTDDVLAQLGGRGYGATGFSTTSRARVRAAAQQTWTDSAQGAYLAFDTTPNGGTSTAETFRMNDTYFIPATDNAVNLGSSTNRLASIKSASATISSSSLSSNAPNVFSQTWNNAGGTFTNLDIAITNTANAAASKAISIHTGAGTELLGVNISGTGTFANGVNNVGSAIKSTAGFWAGANAGFTSRTIDISQYNTHLNLSSGTMLLWESTSTITGAPDTGLERGGAGIVRTTTGSSATAATLSTAGLRLGILTKTTNYTTTIADHTILADATSSNLVVTLIASASAYASPNGNEFTVKKIDSTANTVTVQVSGGANIDGAATDVLTTQYQSHNYQADGTKYWIH